MICSNLKNEIVTDDCEFTLDVKNVNDVNTVIQTVFCKSKNQLRLDKYFEDYDITCRLSSGESDISGQSNKSNKLYKVDKSETTIEIYPQLTSCIIYGNIINCICGVVHDVSKSMADNKDFRRLKYISERIINEENLLDYNLYMRVAGFTIAAETLGDFKYIDKQSYLVKNRKFTIDIPYIGDILHTFRVKKISDVANAHICLWNHRTRDVIISNVIKSEVASDPTKVASYTESNTTTIFPDVSFVSCQALVSKFTSVYIVVELQNYIHVDESTPYNFVIEVGYVFERKKC